MKDASAFATSEYKIKYNAVYPRACFIFRHPKNSNRKRAIFLQPFESNVWVALGYIALAILITGWILKAVELHLPNETSHNGKNQRSILDGFKNKILQGIGLKERRNHLSSLNFNKFSLRNFLNKCQKMNFLDLITFFVGMICFQSAPPNINNLLSGRIVLMSVLFLAFFLLQYYSASITGTLLTPPVKNIKTLRDLIDSDLDLGFEDIIYARDYFKRTTDPEAIAIYEKTGETYERNNSYHAAPKDLKPPKVSHNKKNKVKHQIWLQPKDGMEFVKKGGFALHVTSNTAYKILSERFTEKEICELSEIQLFPPEKMVHIVQKGSPIRKAMMYGLRRVIEHGLVDYQNHIWYFPKPGCVDTIHLEDLVVDMQTFLSAFLILMYGFAASIVILAIELMLNFIAKKLP